MATNKQTIEFNAKGVAKLKKQYKDLEKRTRGLEGATNKSSKSLGGMVAALGLTTAAMYAASRAISSTIKVGANFQKTMSNLAAISGASSEEMKALEQNAKDLGATTVFTASQVGSLSVEFAKLGFTSKEIQGVTKDTLALAAASGSDLSVAASVAGGTLRAFGMDVADTSKVTDTMALSFSSSALDMDKFTNSMQYVGPIASAAGIGVEGATAMLGTLADNMISGSMAGTSLRKILLEAGREGSKLADRMGGPVKSMEDFQEGLKKLNDEGFDVMAEGADLVGNRAVTAFKILLDGVEKTDKLNTSLLNAAGSAQQMADIQLDNLSGKTTLLGSAMEGLGISIFEHMAPSLESAVTGMTSLVGAFDDYIKLQPSDNLRMEQVELNNLANALSRNIDKEQVRNNLIGEINKKYPDFLKGMDQEKLSADEIQKSLKNVNIQYKEKIKLTVQEELIAEQLKKSSKAFKTQAEAAIASENALENLSKRTGVAVDENKSLEENLALQVKRFQELRVAANKGLTNLAELKNMNAITGKSFTDLGTHISFITANLGEAKRTLRVYNKAEREGNVALEEHAKFVKQLDKAMQDIAKAQEESGEAAEGATEKTEEQKKKVVDLTTGYYEFLGLPIPEFYEGIELAQQQSIITAEMVFQAQREQVEGTLEKYSELADGIMNVSDQYTAYEMQNIDNRRQKEIDAAMASNMTEEQKQAKIQNIKEKYAKQERDLRKKQKGPMIAQAIANTAVGVTKALEQSGPLGIALGVLVAAAGAIEVATIQAQEFATGGQFVTNGPEMIKVGDNPSGRELVEITPLGGDPNINGPQGRGITLNISAPLVDETVVDAIIPALERANRMNLA